MVLEKQRLNKDIPIPLYYQLKEILLDHIKKNNLKVGDTIPTEMELASMFNISRPTVRQAISELVNLGYLKKVQGKGTFVCKPKIDQEYTKKIISFNDEMKLKGIKPSTQVLEAKCVLADEHIAYRLGINYGEDIFHLKRLRFANGEPIVFLDSFIPLKVCPGINCEDFVNKSLYGVFRENYGIYIKRVVRSIEVMVAGSKESKLLGIKKGYPIHYFNTIAFSQDEVAVEYSISRYRGDRSKFVVEIIEE